MDKKNILGLLFFMGLFGVIISGMVAFQPEKTAEQYNRANQTAESTLSGFPVLPNN